MINNIVRIIYMKYIYRDILAEKIEYPKKKKCICYFKIHDEIYTQLHTLT